MHKSFVGFCAALAATVLATACGGTDSDSQYRHAKQVDQATFSGTWPVTATSGELACDSSKGNAVTFTADGGKVYAVNTPALGWGKQEGWPDAKEIWNGSNWSSFIDQGLKICEDNK